jgi:small subunit ribosomal protein S13
MPRIAGIDIPEHKKIYMSLQAVYGVGPKIAEQVLAKANVNPDKRARELNGDEVNRIQKVLESYNVEGSLRRMINDNIERLKRVKAYRGLRHIAGLPARGQRTKSNSRNARGGQKRRTVGAMSKEMAAKLDAAKAAK